MAQSVATQLPARLMCNGCVRCALLSPVCSSQFTTSHRSQHSLWRMTDSDFKRSETSSQVSSSSSSDAFSGELFVRVVPELINSGGTFSSISIENTGKGYLTSDEWKLELQRLSSDAEAASNTVVIDVCLLFGPPPPSIAISLCTGAQPQRSGAGSLQRRRRSFHCKLQRVSLLGSKTFARTQAQKSSAVLHWRHPL